MSANIELFIEKYVQKIASKPEQIEVKSSLITEENGNKFKEIQVFAHQGDVGRLIGKDGKMISSLKTLISGAKAKDGQNYRVIVVPRNP